jgi:ABC-2 type transport system permease protein
MISILQEEEEGTLARIFTTPTDRTAVLAGKFLAVLLMVIVQSLVLMFLGTLLFKVTWGDPLKTGMALVGQVVAATSLGVLLISLARNTRQAGAMLGGVLTVLGMLGGLFTVASGGLPGIFDTLGLFTPQGWALRAWKGSLSAGPAVDQLLPLGILLGMGVVMFAIGASIFRRRFA